MSDSARRAQVGKFSEVARVLCTFDVCSDATSSKEKAVISLIDTHSIFSADFIDFHRKVRALGAKVVVTGDAAVRILLQQPVSRTEFMLAVASQTSNHQEDRDELFAQAHDALKLSDIEADASLDSVMRSGAVPTLDAFEEELSQRQFNTETIGFTIGEDDELTLMDHTNAVTGILERRLDLSTTSATAELTLDESIRAVLLAARYGLAPAKRLKTALSEGVSSWSDMQPIRRGELLLEIMSSHKPSSGLILMHENLIMNRVYPQLRDMAGVEEKVVDNEVGKRKYHHKDVFYHTMQVLDNVCELSDDVWLRFAALLHDVAKPRTKAFSPETGWTFHGHAEVGARMVKRMFREFEYPDDKMRYVRKLVALHLRPMALVSEGVTDSAVRRLITDAGGEMDDLLTLCRCDITSKNPGKVTRYLNNYDRLVDIIHDVIARDRVREWQPPITGQEIMERCGIGPSVLVGVFKTKVENAILSGQVDNTKEAALEYLLSIKNEVLAEGNAKKPASVKQRMKSLPKDIDT